MSCRKSVLFLLKPFFTKWSELSLLFESSVFQANLDLSTEDLLDNLQTDKLPSNFARFTPFHFLCQLFRASFFQKRLFAELEITECIFKRNSRRTLLIYVPSKTVFFVHIKANSILLQIIKTFGSRLEFF
jgi:hypothetical protein